MLARRSTLALANGSQLSLPLLVPSFSSKGFPTFKRETGKMKLVLSETTHALEMLGPFLGVSMLISAYDIHHRMFHRPTSFFKGREVVFIDSGGYELAADYDSTEPSQGPYRSRAFNETEYRAVLRRLPTATPLIISNFDWGVRGRPIKEQIRKALELFETNPGTVSNFLIKPTGKKRYLDIDDVRAHAKDYRSFGILGVTEKELGSDFLERLTNLAQIRAELDRQGITIPIHVWGGLDPIMTPLYFFAGAEIFDGVSWLRYAYHNGTAVYRDCYGLLSTGLETSLDHTRAHAMNNNLIVLRKITTALQRFVDSGARDFNVFEWHAETFKSAYAVMQSRIHELKGGA